MNKSIKCLYCILLFLFFSQCHTKRIDVALIYKCTTDSLYFNNNNMLIISDSCQCNHLSEKNIFNKYISNIDFDFKLYTYCITINKEVDFLYFDSEGDDCSSYSNAKIVLPHFKKKTASKGNAIYIYKMLKGDYRTRCG